MNRTYSFKHWMATLFFAPLLATLYEIYFSSVKGQAAGLLDVYPIVLIFSVFFSIPTFIVYYFIFSFLIKKQFNPGLTKLTLISLTVIGIVATVLLIGGSLSMTFIFAYSISAIITGILLRIKIRPGIAETP